MTETQNPIKISIEHQHSVQHGHKQCCDVSVPLPQSLAFSLEQLSLVVSKDDGDTTKTIDALCQIIAYWPDNSIKWLKLTYQYCHQPRLYLNITKLHTNTSDAATNTLIDATDISDVIDVTDSYSYKGGANTLALSLANNRLEILDDNNQAILSLDANDLKLTDSTGQPVAADFSQATVTQQTNLINHNSSAVTLVIDGVFSETFVQFQLIVDWLVPFDLIKCQLQIHNCNRAMHQGGKWDLGDEGSFNFTAFNIQLNTAQTSLKEHHTLTDVQNNQSYSGDSIVCEQFSSGGVNWQSPVHVNHSNTLDLNKNGYELSFGQEQITGMRCQPVLSLKNNLAMTIDKFWQNFPKSLSVKDKIVSLGLFPATDYLYELQGGEKKTHTFWISLNGTSNDLTSIHGVNRGTIAWDWISQCDLYPFIEKSKTEPGSIQSIVELGLEQTNGFITKRENVDEYGWRNFGELYADHETAGYQGEDIFVSHYNNQYDPIYGFLRQYLTTGNTQWFELADDLATHVKDIDIYHTKLDKYEYNGGLFWHTDHYLQAFTSSHRSYSKFQASDVYQDHAGGGGPGGQHCYTTGLYLHYCLTGQQSSKDAVLTLTHWITNVYEGSGTILELLLAFKNRHLAGIKNQFTGQYPLDRGVANYINALLDSYELTIEHQYLEQVETIMANTIHPNEDLTLRNLENVESNWFYVVFLQAVCRYLQLKLQNNTLDQQFYFNRDCLLTYAHWMLENEHPYLEKPEILEYPNDTWTAQDLRKSHVLAAAAYFSPDDGSKFMQKAEYFENYVATKLNVSETKTYTRILALLMQNQGAVDLYKTQSKNTKFKAVAVWPKNADLQTPVIISFTKLMLKRLYRFSFKNELNWLKKRLG